MFGRTVAWELFLLHPQRILSIKAHNSIWVCFCPLLRKCLFFVFSPKNLKMLSLLICFCSGIFFYLCVNVCKYNLLSLLVLLRGIWFQGWPLCIGYPIRGLILGRDWFSLSAVGPLVVGCPELSSFLVAGTYLLVLSLFRFCLGSHNVIMGAAPLSFLVIILIKAFPRL